MKNPSEIQILINSYRAKHKLSQEQLADILEVTQSQICQWEIGTHKPSPLRLRILEKRLKKHAKNIR